MTPDTNETTRHIYVFGNGLSLAYNSEYYSLGSLTTRVRSDLATQPGVNPGRSALEDVNDLVDRLQEDVSAHSGGQHVNFEELAGPLERLAAALEHMSVWQSLSTDAADRRALDSLTASAARLYRQVTGAVLSVVTAHVDGLGNTAAIQTVAEHLVNICRAQRDLDVFVLNYDALLDSALLHLYNEPGPNHRRSDAGFSLSDEFDGRPDHRRSFPISG